MPLRQEFREISGFCPIAKFAQVDFTAHFLYFEAVLSVEESAGLDQTFQAFFYQHMKESHA